MKSINKLLTFLISLLTLLLPILSVSGNIQIEINSGTQKAQPIVIFPFQYKGLDKIKHNLKNINNLYLENIIISDLKNTGKFKTINPKSLSINNNNISKIKPNFWKQLEINSIVIGKIKQINNQYYDISYYLMNVTNYPHAKLLHNHFTVKHKSLRYIAHTISDEIFEKLTGIHGVFRTHIAYIVKMNNKKNQYELRVADYDGYNQTIIHKSKDPLMSPSWSHDGKKIAYVTFEYGNNSSIVIQNLKTGKIKQIVSFKRHNGAPAFSPDGMKLAFVLSKTGSLNIYIMDLINGKIKQLTHSYSNNTEPSWLPDSKSIIYTSDQSGKTQIYKININNQNQERITWNENRNQNPNVSHNGNFIVMVNLSDKKQRIAKQNLNTGSLEFLTDSVLNESPSLSPNDNMIIYNNASQISNTMLQIVSSDGRNKTDLPITDGQVKFPIWSPCS